MIYLDNGATTFPKPQSVYNSVARSLKEFGANPGRSGHKLSLRAATEVFECREAVAKFFNVKAVENIIFTLNCTTASNIVLKGLLNPGDHVVISPLEHNAVMRPLNVLKDKDVSYTVAEIFPENDDLTLDSFRKSLTEKTKLIVCMHASNVWGYKLPVERLAALAHIYGIQIMVDAAQSAGIVPIDMEKTKIDYICTAGHKGLYGPMGTGLLLTSTPEKLHTFVEGGTGSNSFSPIQPQNSPDKFESGTPNLSGIAGLRAGIKFVESRGASSICRQEISLLDRLYDKLKNTKNVILYTDRPTVENYVPVLSFNIKDKHSEEISILMDKQNIAVRGGFHCSPMAHQFMKTEEVGSVRITPSVFTTKNEIDYAAQVINRIARS